MENCEIMEHMLEWERISIKISYKPNYFASVGVSHLEVHANEPLPFTETGYRSIWLMKGELDGTNELQFVKDALEHDRHSSKWLNYVKERDSTLLKKTQLSLF